ncbi:MAG: inorganic phosphate transporter [Parachlamydiaceae bacterium]
MLLIAVLAAGLYMAWNIGANDVANAMGTSVGSGALTLKSAILVAGVLEFSGAFFFGSHVSETMQKGIINPEVFAEVPMDLVLGMLAALIGTGIWLQIASYFGWPVSTTHAIVGAIVGFGALIGGLESIYWDQVAYISVSWVLSPLLGALFGYALFNLIRKKIFFAPHPLASAKKIIPILTGSVALLLSLFVIYNALENIFLEISILESLVYALMAAALGYFISKWLIRKKIPHILLEKRELSRAHREQLEAAKDQLAQAEKLAQKGFQIQMEGLIHELKGTIHNLENADEFNYTKLEFNYIEKMFAWLQILSASMMAFAHGANDVANAIGPLAAALFVLQTGSVAIDPEIPTWILALGGFGIVLGLATWGWRVIETIGKKLTELTPTRGFAAEFGAAITILAASKLGLPISTTHTLVGAVLGIGFARGIEAINLGMTRDIVVSWLVTLPAGALMASGVFLALRFALTLTQ